eukprot:gene9046-9217_t
MERVGLVRRGCNPPGVQAQSAPLVQASRQDYAGTDIDWMNQDSAQRCLSACRSNADCAFMVYTTDKTCYLKANFQKGPNGRNTISQGVQQSCIKDEAVIDGGPGLAAKCSDPGDIKGIISNTAFNGEKLTPVRVIFMNLQWCSSGAAVDTGRLEAEILYDSFNSLQQYYPTISRGRVFFDRKTSIVVDVTLPCDRFPMDKCDYDAWMRYIQENHKALGIADYEKYPVKVSIAPGTEKCRANYAPVAGFAAGSGVFLHGWSSLDISTVKHELGHVQGLGHANWINKYNKFEEYGDLSTPMGISCGNCHFSAPELVQLGWAAPFQGGVVHWSTVKPGTKLTFALSPLADDAGKSIITVFMQFDPSGTSLSSLKTGTTQELYLSYRVAKGQDNGLPNRYSQATNVHTVQRLGATTGNILLVAWLKTGWAFIDHSSQLVVYQASGDESTASVVLCRYTNVPRDCGDSFVDFSTVPEAEAGLAGAISAAMALRYPGAAGGRNAVEAADGGVHGYHY